MRKGQHGIIWDAFPVHEEGVQTWERFKKQTAIAKPFMAPISAVDPEARKTFDAMDATGFLDPRQHDCTELPHHKEGAKSRDMAPLDTRAQTSPTL